MADPNLFINSFGGGFQTGSAIGKLFRDHQDRRQNSVLADLFRQGQYEDVGAALAGRGDFQGAVDMAQIPWKREQQRLQQDFQNAQFQALNSYRQQQLAQSQQPALPDGYMWTDPRNPAGGVTPLPGYDPSKSSTTTWLAPVDEIGEDGNPVVVQYSNRGDRRIIEGAKPSNPIQKIDTGTEIQVIDSRTGAVLSRTPKENFQEAYQTESGKGAAKSYQESRAGLPKVEGQAQQMLAVIDRLENDPNMDAALGFVQGNLPSFLAGAGGLAGSPQGIEDFRAIKSQLEGQAFLQAFESLKGGGQITEIEGRKATDAMAAMRDTQSPQEFRRQLRILRGVINQGLDRARKSAQGPAPVSPTVNVPSPMTAGKTRQDAITISNEADADALPSGTWINLNGRVGQVE